jgi:YEATS domain-containing protein 4
MIAFYCFDEVEVFRAYSKNITVVKPIVYGNSARYFGKKREEDNHTHEWTFYLKPYENEDPSSYIQRVHIKLHDSYTNSNRSPIIAFQ